MPGDRVEDLQLVNCHATFLLPNLRTRPQSLPCSITGSLRIRYKIFSLDGGALSNKFFEWPLVRFVMSRTGFWALKNLRSRKTANVSSDFVDRPDTQKRCSETRPLMKSALLILRDKVLSFPGQNALSRRSGDD